MRVLPGCSDLCAPTPAPAAFDLRHGPAPLLPTTPPPPAPEAGAGAVTGAGAQGGVGAPAPGNPSMSLLTASPLPGSFTALLSVGLLAVVGFVFLASIVGAFTIWLRAVGGAGGGAGAAGEAAEPEGMGESGNGEEGEEGQSRLVRRPPPAGLNPALLAYLPSYVFTPASPGAEPAAAPPADGRGTPGVAGGDPDCQQVEALEGEEGGLARQGNLSETRQEGAGKERLLAGGAGAGAPLPPAGARWRECPVCLCEFEAGDVVTCLPRCRHAFHGPCIEAWLGSHGTCPLCRVPVKPELEDLAAAVHPARPGPAQEPQAPLQPSQPGSPTHAQARAQLGMPPPPPPPPPQPQPQPQPQSQSQSQSQAESQPQSQPESQSQAQSQPQTSSSPQAQSDSRPPPRSQPPL